MADEKKKSGWGQQMIDRVTWASKNPHGRGMGQTMGGIMAAMGTPWHQRAAGGEWWTVDPANQAYYPHGMQLGNMAGGGGPQIEDPALPPVDPNDPNDPNNPDSSKFAWRFPQYSQTWAFTPPAPTPYPYPQPFDTKKYGDPFK